MPSLKLASKDIFVGEADGFADLVVRLLDPGPGTVTVNYTTVNGTATSSNAADFVNASGTLNFAPGETTKTVRVPLSDSTSVEGLEFFTFTLNSPAGATITPGLGTATVWIVDNEPAVATPTLHVRDVVVDERDGTAAFVVLLGGPEGQRGNGVVTVDYATFDGGASAGSDFLAASGTLVFAPGESVKTVVVDLLDDTQPEGLERFRLELASAAGAVIVDGSGLAEIGANDAAAVSQPQVSVARDVFVGEGEGWIDLVVGLSAPGQNAVTVNYGTANGTATSSNNSDFVPVAGTLNFAPGETTKTVRVPLSDTISFEDLEFFDFTIGSPANASIPAGEGTTRVWIVDNGPAMDTPTLYVRDLVVDERDGTAAFVVLLGGPEGYRGNSVVTVGYTTVDGSASAGSDYLAASGTLVFAPGESVKTVVVDLLDDAQPEGLERFRLELANAASAVIVDGSGLAEIGASDTAAVSQPQVSVARDVYAGEGDGWIDLVVGLSAPGQNTVTVNYATANGTATSSNNSDFVPVAGSLNFAPGETTKTVRVQLSDNGSVEDLEFFDLTLGSPANASIPAGEGTARVWVVDNDPLVDTPGLFVRDVIVDETNGTARFAVMLGGTSGLGGNSIVTVDYATIDGSASAGSDYLAASGTLVFAPGESVKTVVVDLLDDAQPEGPERFRLELANAASAVIVDGSGLAEIGASDAAPVSQPQLSVARDVYAGEGDGWIDLVVGLGAPGQNTVTVNYTTANGTATSSNNSDFVPVVGSLNFAPGETTKTVRVQISDNGSAEDLEFFDLTLGSPANASIPAGEGTTRVWIVDNDPLVDTPGLFVRDVIVDETNGTARFAVMLGGTSGLGGNSIVTVDYATIDGSASAGSDYLAASGTLVFAPGESVKTVVVDLLDDTQPEGVERFRLQLDHATSATIVQGSAYGEIGASDAAAQISPTLRVAREVYVGEADAYVELVVGLDAPAQQRVTVAYATGNGTATSSNNSDFVPTSGTLGFAPGETTATVRVPISDSTSIESLESFQFTLSSPVNAVLAPGQATTTVRIVDNDIRLDTPSVFVHDIVVDEAAGVARVHVTLGSPGNVQGVASSSVVSVDYATAGGTALGGLDYVPTSGTVKFAPGETVRTIVVDLVPDLLSEPAETFSVTLSNATNALIDDGQATVTIEAHTATPSDTTPPTASTFSPADGATGVAVGSNVVVTFNEAIQRGSGTVVLKTAAGAVVASYDAATSANLDISGSTLTLNPTADLAFGTQYFVEFAAGSIEDLAGNDYAGTSSYDFTTAAAPQPLSKSDNFVVAQYASPAILGSGPGNDTYLLSPSLLPAGTTLTLTDTEGSNSVQLAQGLDIASSRVAANALQLTLDNGSVITMLGASQFSYEAGGNTSAGLNGTDLGYAAFVQQVLGVAVPTGSVIVTGGALVVGGGAALPAFPAGTKADNFVVAQYASPSILGSGPGNDTYLLSPSLLPAGTTLTLTDTEGSNSVQLAQGLDIASSRVAANALQLTLGNGSVITMLGASQFSYEAGGNSSAGIDGPDLGYAAFVQQVLGVTVPTGSAIVTGGPVLIGPPPAPGSAGSGVSGFAMVGGAQQASTQLGPIARGSDVDVGAAADMSAITLVGVIDAAAVSVGPA